MSNLVIRFLIFIAVQHERGPRNSTLRRQMAMYLKEPEVINTLVPPTPAAAAAAAAALDLALPKSPLDHRIQPPIAPPGAAPHHHHHHHHHHRHPHSMPHPIYAHASINMCKVSKLIPLFKIQTIYVLKMQFKNHFKNHLRKRIPTNGNKFTDTNDTTRNTNNAGNNTRTSLRTSGTNTLH